jgi:hypothetical protein
VPESPGFTEVLLALSEIPVVALGLGSVAGMGAARVCASHYSIMVRGTSQLFAAGPPVVARAGQTLTKEELGGTHIHVKNGTIDDETATEEEAFARARRFLSYLPSSVHELAARQPTNDLPDRADEGLLSVIPRDARKVYKMRPIVETLVDAGSFFEFGKAWGKSVITGLARLDGWPVAILASDPYHYGGAWTADASRKAIRMIDLAQTFQLPVVHRRHSRLPDRQGGGGLGVMRFAAGARRPRRPRCPGAPSWCARLRHGRPRSATALLPSCGMPGRRRNGARCHRRRRRAAYRAVIEAAPDCRQACGDRGQARGAAVAAAHRRSVRRGEIIDPRLTGVTSAGLRPRRAAAAASRPRFFADLTADRRLAVPGSCEAKCGRQFPSPPIATRLGSA